MARLLFIVIILFTGVIAAQAQQIDAEIRTNEEIMLDEIRSAIIKSVLINATDHPFSLQANLPDAKRIHIYNQLLELGKSVRSGNEPPVLQFLLYPDHRLNQTERNTVNRIIQGEIQLLMSDENAEITNTESIRFSYSDTIPISLAGELESDWNGAAFAQKNLKPERNAWRQIGQPAIIATATGVAVFLLFNIRSN